MLINIYTSVTAGLQNAAGNFLQWPCLTSSLFNWRETKLYNSLANIGLVH